MKYLFITIPLFLLLISPLAYSETVSSVAISPRGAVLQAGSTQQFSATCTYSDGSTDNCAAAGGATWSTSRPTVLPVNSSGLVKAATDPGAGSVSDSFVLVSAGGARDRASVYVQHPGDTFYQYMTPDYRTYQTSTQPTAVKLPLNVVVGSSVAIGSGIITNYDGPEHWKAF